MEKELAKSLRGIKIYLAFIVGELGILIGLLSTIK